MDSLQQSSCHTTRRPHIRTMPDDFRSRWTGKHVKSRQPVTSLEGRSDTLSAASTPDTVLLISLGMMVARCAEVSRGTPRTMSMIQGRRAVAWRLRTVAQLARQPEPECVYLINDMQTFLRPLTMMQRPTGWRSIMKKKSLGALRMGDTGKEDLACIGGADATRTFVAIQRQRVDAQFLTPKRRHDAICTLLTVTCHVRPPPITATGSQLSSRRRWRLRACIYLLGTFHASHEMCQKRFAC